MVIIFLNKSLNNVTGIIFFLLTDLMKGSTAAMNTSLKYNMR